MTKNMEEALKIGDEMIEFLKKVEKGTIQLEQPTNYRDLTKTTIKTKKDGKDGE